MVTPILRNSERNGRNDGDHFNNHDIRWPCRVALTPIEITERLCGADADRAHQSELFIEKASTNSRASQFLKFSIEPERSDRGNAR